MGFRNVRVHEYARIDYELVHKALSAELGQLEEAVGVFAGLLKDELAG